MNRFDIIELIILIAPCTFVFIGFIFSLPQLLQFTCISFPVFFSIPNIAIRLTKPLFRKLTLIISLAWAVFSVIPKYYSNDKLLHTLFILPILYIVLQLLILILFKSILKKNPIPTWRGDKIGEYSTEYKRNFELLDFVWSISLPFMLLFTFYLILEFNS